MKTSRPEGDLEKYNKIRKYYNFYLTRAPNGINASFAILKNCVPNGIPMTVMQRRRPMIALAIAISMPKNRIHIRLARKENAPPPYTTSFPNGQKDNAANLKHCLPYGIPTIVIHHKNPETNHIRPLAIPPRKSQRILPIRLMFVTPFVEFFTMGVLLQINLMKV